MLPCAVNQYKKKKLVNVWGCVRKRLGNDRGFHQLFACGCADKRREFDKGRDKQLLKRLYNTYSYIILTRPVP